MTTIPYVPFEARVKPEVLAVARALHKTESECLRPWQSCDASDHEDDALALLAWLDEYDFEVVRKP